jgi:hypothetical protein
MTGIGKIARKSARIEIEMIAKIARMSARRNVGRAAVTMIGGSPLRRARKTGGNPQIKRENAEKSQHSPSLFLCPRPCPR